ncbi:MAG: protein-glutamate O-methyltransferase CheR [Gemmatimonadota bacterium]|nr:protein-glutamate O-methyltransferase CheR [Gemmatimonadota bacterium]
MTSFAEFMRVIDEDSIEYERLIASLTINVTKFFRNPEVYACVAQRVVPELWAAETRSLQLWSAGGATGEEAYSTAGLGARHAAAVGEEERLARVAVLGSDIDDQAVQMAIRGQYHPSALVDFPADPSERYFNVDGGLYSVSKGIRNLVRFARHDILDPAIPGHRMDLIFCRNVVIYFTREVQEALIRRFHEVLLPGGYLVLGKVETLVGTTREMFAPVSTRDRVFRKI